MDNPYILPTQAPGEGLQWSFINGAWQAVPIDPGGLGIGIEPEPIDQGGVGLPLPELGVGISPETNQSGPTDGGGLALPMPEPPPGGIDTGGTSYGLPGPGPATPPSGPIDPGGYGIPLPPTGGNTTNPGGPFPEFTPTRYTPTASFSAPPPFTYDAFQFDAFKAPSINDAMNEPGYQFAFDEGRKALERSAAAKGVLRTGGTLKDILGWGTKFAEQNYGNVYNRAGETYDRNRSNAFGNWAANRENAAGNYSTNYGIARDTWDRNDSLVGSAWDRNFAAEQAAFNPKFRGAELTFADLYNRFALGQDDNYKRWRDQLDAMTRIATMPPLD